MVRRWLRPIRRQADGSFRVDLSNPERELIVSAMQQLRELLFANAAAVRRLFPAAYADDPEADRAYRDRQGMVLLDARFRSIGVVEDSIGNTVLTEEQLADWMQSINAVRLVIGTALDVNERGEPGVDTGGEDVQQLLASYEYLGMLLMHIVHALREALPPDPLP